MVYSKAKPNSVSAGELRGKACPYNDIQPWFLEYHCHL